MTTDGEDCACDWGISIHKALASLDMQTMIEVQGQQDFDPQGSREPRQQYGKNVWNMFHFDPQGSREPRPLESVKLQDLRNFDPQGSREPRRKVMAKTKSSVNFDPQGSREPRLRGQDGKYSPETISIHKALASLDELQDLQQQMFQNFDPQGSREPRQILPL